MLTKRIIPCLDVDHGRVKKGIHFVSLTDVGDPAEIAAAYQKQGADELVFLDITATVEKRAAMVDTIEKVASQVFMPLTVGGGVHNIEGMQQLLHAGADKIALNSAAVRDPQLLTAGAEKFGAQCMTAAIDVKKNADGEYEVVIDGGRTKTGFEAIGWAKKAVALGAGELLVTSMDQDGTKKGFDLNLYQKLTEAVNVPIIASGGAGSIQDFVDLFTKTSVSGGLAASVFHYGELTIPQVKEALKAKGVPVRCS